MTLLTKSRLMGAARSPWLWPAAIGLSALAVALIVFGGVGGPARALIALWFLLVCPGMAFVRLLRVNDGAFELSLAIALSLALDAIVAGVMLYAKIWSPETALGVLIGLSCLGAVLQVAQHAADSRA
jgi:hypothetical protein